MDEPDFSFYRCRNHRILEVVTLDTYIAPIVSGHRPLWDLTFLHLWFSVGTLVKLRVREIRSNYPTGVSAETLGAESPQRFNSSKKKDSVSNLRASLKKEDNNHSVEANIGLNKKNTSDVRESETHTCWPFL